MTAQLRPRTDSSPVADACLSTQDGIVLDRDTPGQPHLGRHDDVPSNLAVVSYVNQIVELRAGADTSGVQGPSVHTGIRADLDIVTDLDAPNLRERLVVVGLEHQAEARPPHNGTAMEDDTVTE